MAQGSNNNEAFLGSAMQFMQAGQNMAQQFMDQLNKAAPAFGNAPPPQPIHRC
jgi:polyhydroxyalkanoate synthase subunit PhaC